MTVIPVITSIGSSRTIAKTSWPVTPLMIRANDAKTAPINAAEV
jgi:hypothetical protein